MKVIYTRYETSNFLADLGQDVVHFSIYFKVDDLPEVSIGLQWSYYELTKWVKVTNPPVYDYLKNMRASITGYGPKETKVLAKIEEEGFDLAPFIKDYLESKDALYITQHLEWVDRMNVPKTQEKVKKTLDNFSTALGQNYASNQIKRDQFLDELNQTVHELTFRYFPELFESGEEKINAYRTALSSVSFDFASRLDKLLNSDATP